MMRRPTAFLPVALSLAGLVLVLGHVAGTGPGPEADEGTVARLWWLLMGAQVPVVAFFALTYLPRATRPSLLVLAIQAAGVVSNLATVRLFNL